MWPCPLVVESFATATGIEGNQTIMEKVSIVQRLEVRQELGMMLIVKKLWIIFAKNNFFYRKLKILKKDSIDIF